MINHYDYTLVEKEVKASLIKIIKCWIKQNFNKNITIIASTDIAAFNINSLIVHRLLQLPIEHDHTPKYKQLDVLKILRADLKDIIFFIIEVSMISDKLTYTYIYDYLKYLIQLIVMMVNLIENIFFYLEICFNYFLYMKILFCIFIK